MKQLRLFDGPPTEILLEALCQAAENMICALNRTEPTQEQIAAAEKPLRQVAANVCQYLALRSYDEPARIVSTWISNYQELLSILSKTQVRYATEQEKQRLEAIRKEFDDVS